MSGLLIATVLSVASPAIDVPSSTATRTAFADRALDDDELGAVRGARGIVFSGGRGALPRLTRDVMVRELSLPRSLTQQQFDNWFNDVGAQLIFDNLTR